MYVVRIGPAGKKSRKKPEKNPCSYTYIARYILLTKHYLNMYARLCGIYITYSFSLPHQGKYH